MWAFTSDREVSKGACNDALLVGMGDSVKQGLWKMKAAKNRREDFYDPEHDWNCQRPVCWHENLVEGATSNGRRRLPPKSVAEADLGGRLALHGSDG